MVLLCSSLQAKHLIASVSEAHWVFLIQDPVLYRRVLLIQAPVLYEQSKVTINLLIHQSILLLDIPRRLFCFGSLVILDVGCRYLSLFVLYINTKIGKNRC